MELESSLPHSQVPANCTYPEPTRSSPYPHIPLPEDPLSSHLRLGVNLSYYYYYYYYYYRHHQQQHLFSFFFRLFVFSVLLPCSSALFAIFHAAILPAHWKQNNQLLCLLLLKFLYCPEGYVSYTGSRHTSNFTEWINFLCLMQGWLTAEWDCRMVRCVRPSVQHGELFWLGVTGTR